MAESNLFLISAQGPGSFSFNEFNPIFTRNRIALQGSGLVGENDTKSGEGIVSGIYKKLSFSAGFTYFDTEGWRANADQKDKIADVFAQYELSPSTSIQAEYRYRDIKRGDTALWFFDNDFFPGLNQETNTSMGRIGFRQSVSPSSVVIGNFSYQTLNGTDQNQLDPDFGFKFKTDQDAYGSELQYLFRSQYLNLLTGVGYFNIDGKAKDNFEIGPPPIFQFQDRASLDFEHYNGYVYSYLKPVGSLTFTVGGSVDFQNADTELTEEKSQFNPKFGVAWNPVPDTTLRAAAFRVLKRTLITDQTVEPTQVAGFNQFFDELNATDYWVFGGAIDQKFSQKVYGGAGYTYRNLNVPFQDFDVNTLTSSLANTNWREKILRTYLFWTPCDWLSLTAEYMLERLDREEDLALGAKEATTNYLPLGLNFFHPSGLSLSLKATYVDQKGEFERKDNVGVFENGDDNFWLFDAAVRYRLPKQVRFPDRGGDEPV